MNATKGSVVGQVLARVPLIDAQLAGFVLSPSVRAQPWRFFATAQRRRPVLRTKYGVIIVSRHADVDHVLRSHDTSVVEARSTAFAHDDRSGAFNELIGSTMLFVDPPDHERLRRVVARAFTPRRVVELRSKVEDIVDRCLGSLDPLGAADLVSDLAYPVPVEVIADLLGILPEDRAPLRAWSAALAARLDVSPMRDPIVEREGDRAAAEFATHLTEAARDPAKRLPGGLFDELVDAAHDDRLSEREAVTNAMLLLAAGHETTSNLVSVSLLSLLQNPASADDLRGGAPIEIAVEELLRYASPVQLTQRVLLEPMKLAGEMVEAGELVILLLGAANRDPAVFAQPQKLDLHRDPNPHLGFGFGLHACLGAALARLEAAVILPAVLERWPRLRLAGRPRWRPTFVLRGLSSLPLRWD